MKNNKYCINLTNPTINAVNTVYPLNIDSAHKTKNTHTRLDTGMHSKYLKSTENNFDQTFKWGYFFRLYKHKIQY